MAQATAASDTNPTVRPEPDRNLALDLLRVTEAAAMAAGRWVGRRDKDGADAAAVAAMRVMMGTVTMDGVVVIGEGEKDDAPMLYNGERVGSGTGTPCDDDLVSGDNSFFVMTGITDGELLHGVRYGRDRAITESLVMRSRSGTVRQVRSTHHLDRLARYSTVDYRHA